MSKRMGITALNDPHSWICECGNTPESAGFYPCLGDGTEVEPFAGGAWGGHLYVCSECLHVIDQGSEENGWEAHYVS